MESLNHYFDGFDIIMLLNCIRCAFGLWINGMITWMVMGGFRPGAYCSKRVSHGPALSGGEVDSVEVDLSRSV